MVKIALNFTS